MADEVRRTVDGQERKALIVTSSSEGASDDAAWNGTDPDASVVSILKAIYAQNVTMIAHLAAIETNTGTP